MKLSSLTQQDKIKLAAELDGYSNVRPLIVRNVTERGDDRFCGMTSDSGWCPHYSTSYDAIIPLIQKLRHGNESLHAEVLDALGELGHKGYYTEATPSQLLDALLVATGKATL